MTGHKYEDWLLSTSHLTLTNIVPVSLSSPVKVKKTEKCTDRIKKKMNAFIKKADISEIFDLKQGNHLNLRSRSTK